MLNRRGFNLGLASAAFGGLALASCAGVTDKLKRIPGFSTGRMRRFAGYGELIPDRHEERLLDLPAGFSYDIISERVMRDGGPLPDKADGMGSFRLDASRVVLVRNHELSAGDFAKGPFPNGGSAQLAVFDRDLATGQALPGGTTTLIYDHVHRHVEREYLSLSGTIRNCAGGTTCWGSWLTCEENVTRRGQGVGQDHGWVFEVPALHDGLVRPEPLKKLGRFNHEAAAVDPRTGIVYMTEDQIDGLFYRFVPERRGDLTEGRLEALVLADGAVGMDTRNWGSVEMRRGTSWPVRWVELDGFEAPAGDDLRKRGFEEKGATRFACGEGIHFGLGELYFCCTSGGSIRSGQIMRYRPPPNERATGDGDAPGTLDLFLETNEHQAFNYGDNLTVAPNGHLLVYEDPYFGGEGNYMFRPVAKFLGAAPPCYVRGVTPTGAVYNLARLHGGSELAGVCFSPDGEVLFVNVQSPARTLAIRGSWNWGDRLGDWKIPEARVSAG